MIATSASTTIYCYSVCWRGHRLLMTAETQCDCATPGDGLEVLHHLDDDGRHYCPTGMLMCSACMGFADDPDPQPCPEDARW